MKISLLFSFLSHVHCISREGNRGAQTCAKGLLGRPNTRKLIHVPRFTNSLSICILFNFTCSIVSWSRSLSFLNSPSGPSTKVSSSHPYAVLEHWTQRSTQTPMPTTLETLLRISTKLRIFNRTSRIIVQAETDNRATTPPRPRDPCYPCRSYTPTDLPYLYNTTGHTINTGDTHRTLDFFEPSVCHAPFSFFDVYYRAISIDFSTCDGDVRGLQELARV